MTEPVRQRLTVFCQNLRELRPDSFPVGDDRYMTLRSLGHIGLPPHRSAGGFDHADVHLPTDRIYVAHTANDSVDVIDCAQDRYIDRFLD
jgi:hypothetical protein